MKYTDEKNVLLLIALLKEYGIHRIIASPGTTNMTFVASLQNDDFFRLYSCVDERSAAYMACGLASDGEPVVITCTGATASRNYMPGLTEAFYRKLPVLAVCGHRGISQIGHLKDQQLDRREAPADIAVERVWMPLIKDWDDEQFCFNEASRAILALKHNGGGPSIINLCTAYSQNMSVEQLPVVTAVRMHEDTTAMPPLPQGRIAVFAGESMDYTQEEETAIDAFCAANNAVVFCDHTSGYHGKYAVHGALFLAQKTRSDLAWVYLLITIGEISGDGYSTSIYPKWEWRVSEDGNIRNRFGHLSRIFDMSLCDFFSYYAKDDNIITRGKQQDEFLQECKTEYDKVYRLIPELPFCNIWMAQHLANRLPSSSFLQLGILNSLRSWNFFELPKGVISSSNVGGFGIDGTLSTTIGRSLLYPDHLHFCVLGDLAFFYDMNVLGNRHIGNNLRILLINNGMGAEFRNYDHPAYFLGDLAAPYIAAAGHYGNKSKSLVKGYVEALEYGYMAAHNKEEFLSQIDDFVSPNISTSIVWEVFVEQQAENSALEIMLNLVPKPADDVPLQKKIKRQIKSIMGEDKIQAIKTLLK